MNKVVRGNYPVSKLPADLREGLDPSAQVSVTVVQDSDVKAPHDLEEILSARSAPFRASEEIVSAVRTLRDEWDA
jgi:hypothetical protein